NRNKKSVTLDLRVPEGQRLLHELVRHVDAVIHNFKNEFVQARGLSYETLSAINPRVVYCGMTGYGESGPYKDQPGYDLMAMAIGGAMSVTGEPDRPPIKSAISFGDILTGYNAAVGVLSALLARRDSDTGQKISVNLLDSIVATLVAPMGIYFGSGNVPPRESPNQGQQFSPGGTFPTSDGYVAISANQDKFFRKLCQAVGHAEWVDDPRFKERSQRVAHRDDLRSLLEETLRTRTTKEWMVVFREYGLAAGPIQTLDQVAVDPQVLHNGMVFPIDHPKCGPVRMLGTPVHFPGQDFATYRPPPALGEHTDEVLREYLSLSEDTLQDLRARHVI
ncbi:MAG: CoA transferase, partial [Chloroflexi bacterium]|nr:CoA transferase [Chloroflexota bacterium]